MGSESKGLGAVDAPAVDSCSAGSGAGTLGRRIAIWGVTGSGKTTLSRRLGELLGLEVVQLDAIRHAKGWDSTDHNEFRSTLEAKLEAATNGWICEGGYTRVMPAYQSRLDTVIWLRFPLRVTFPRLVRRCWTRARSQEPLYGPGGPRETLRMSFASRDSLLLYSLMTHRSVTRERRERVASLPSSVRVHVLRSAREVERFVLEQELLARCGVAFPGASGRST